MTVSQVSPETWTDEQRLAFSSALRELGGTFRRLEALNYERMADEGNGFDAVRVTLTKPDGSEVARLVRVDASVRQKLGLVAREAVERIEVVVGSRELARDALVAFLADDEPTPEDPAQLNEPKIKRRKKS
jgi:ATP-dependent protease Clp ATPase subunit